MFVECRLDGFYSKVSGGFLIRNDQTFDHGVILKINPVNQPGRTWICCAGLGEWGTSGAAWYLSRRWRDLHSRLGAKPFAMIVRIRPGQDESAEPVVFGSTPQEIEAFVRS